MTWFPKFDVSLEVKLRSYPIGGDQVFTVGACPLLKGSKQGI